MRALIVSNVRPCAAHNYYREFNVDFEVANRDDSVHTVMVPKEMPVNFGINDMIEFDGSLHTYYVGDSSQTYIKITSMSVIEPDASCDNTMCITGVIKRVDQRTGGGIGAQERLEDYKTPVTRFSVAVHEGNERELYYCVAFKKQAADIAMLPIGTKIFVQGKLAKRHFTDKNKNAKIAVELYVRFYSPQPDVDQAFKDENSND